MENNLLYEFYQNSKFIYKTKLEKNFLKFYNELRSKEKYRNEEFIVKFYRNGTLEKEIRLDMTGGEN